MPETNRIQGLYSTEEYLRINELGGESIGEILGDHPSDQVATLCQVALRDFELHGNGDFIKKVLDTALEQTPSIRDSGYSRKSNTRGSRDAERLIDAYIEIATTAYKTGQDGGYVTGILDSAVTTATEGAQGTFIRSDIVDIARAAITTEQPSQYMEKLAGIMYEAHQFDTPEGYYSAVDFPGFLERISTWGLADDYIYRYTEKLHRDSRDQKEPTAQATGLMTAAKIGFENFGEQKPEYAGKVIEEAKAAIHTIDDDQARINKLGGLAKLADETEQPVGYTRKLIDDMRVEAASAGKKVSEIKCLEKTIKLAHETGQPEDYIGELLSQAVEVALREDRPRNVVNELRRFIKVAVAVEYEERDQRILKPGVDFIRGVDTTNTPERYRHMLLNQLLRSFTVPQVTLESNGIEERPSTLSFTLQR